MTKRTHVCRVDGLSRILSTSSVMFCSFHLKTEQKACWVLLVTPDGGRVGFITNDTDAQAHTTGVTLYQTSVCISISPIWILEHTPHHLIPVPRDATKKKKPSLPTTHNLLAWHIHQISPQKSLSLLQKG